MSSSSMITEIFWEFYPKNWHIWAYAAVYWIWKLWCTSWTILIVIIYVSMVQFIPNESKFRNKRHSAWKIIIAKWFMSYTVGNLLAPMRGKSNVITFLHRVIRRDAMDPTKFFFKLYYNNTCLDKDVFQIVQKQNMNWKGNIDYKWPTLSGIFVRNCWK